MPRTRRQDGDRPAEVVVVHQVSARAVVGIPARSLRALWLIEQLGFNYKTMLTWSKIGRPGIGQYFRGRTEQLLFAVRGNGKRLRDRWTPRRDLSTLIEAPRVTDAHGKSIHSAKPIEAYRLIEAASPPPRLEMFARGRRRGWTPWGNEI